MFFCVFYGTREISFLTDWCKTHSPLAGGAAPTATIGGIHSSNWQHMLQQLDNLAP
jgi:hypothetical protein